MVQVQNASTIKEIRTAAGLSLSEGFPQQLSNQIFPVININPKDYKIAKSVDNDGTTTYTIKAADSTKEIYLTGFFLSAINTAATTCTLMRLTIVIDGATKSLGTIFLVPSGANFNSMARDFKNPVKIDKNTAVTATLDAAASNAWAGVTYFELTPFEDI